MKKMFAVLVAIFVFCSSTAVWAEEEAGQKTFSISGELGSFTPYIGEYTGEKLSNGMVGQPSLTLTHNSSGLYVGALGYITRTGVDEVDIYLGYASELAGFKLDAGYSFCNITDTNGDLHAFYIGAESPEIIAGVSLTGYLEADIPVDKEILEGGWIWKFGAKKSVPIAEQSVEFRLEAGGNDGIYGYEPELVSFARGTISTEVEKLGMKFVPSLALQKGFGGIAGKEWRAIAGLAILFE